MDVLRNERGRGRLTGQGRGFAPQYKNDHYGGRKIEFWRESEPSWNRGKFCRAFKYFLTPFSPIVMYSFCLIMAHFNFYMI